MSPFEHVARPATYDDAEEELRREGVAVHDFEHGKGVTIDLRKFHIGKLRGWVPYRWTIPGESIFGGGEP